MNCYKNVVISLGILNICQDCGISLKFGYALETQIKKGIYKNKSEYGPIVYQLSLIFTLINQFSYCFTKKQIFLKF